MRRLMISGTLAITLLFAVSASAQTIQINRENKTIAISTTDEATAIADIATINVGFDLYDGDSDSAYAAAGKLSHTILEAIQKAGIDDKSIESKNQTLTRNDRFDDKDTKEQRAKKQFHFEQSWEVTTSPKNAAVVIRLAIAAGANQTGQIEWRLADRKSLQAQAAAYALVKARGVATQMADGLHVRLGALIYASNETPNTKLYFLRPQNGLVLSADSAQIGSLPLGLPLEIRPQTIREEATVYAVFSIE